MVISKNLRSYVEQTINTKMREANQEMWKKKREKFDTIRDELDAIQAKAMEKCIKIIEEKGLIPEDFGYHPYGEGGFPTPLLRNRYYDRVNYRDEQAVVQEILLKIELEEIPKKEVMDFVNNYDVSKFFKN